MRFGTKPCKVLLLLGVRNSYFERDVNADLTLFIKKRRKFKGDLPKSYNECLLYYKRQRAYFKNLKPIVIHEEGENQRCSGKISAVMPGVYNSLH